MKEGVIVLGGSCFMGRQLVDLLMAKWPDTNVFTINRGNTYWSEYRPPSLVADRRRASSYREAVQELLAQSYTWKAVIDFCAFTAEDISDALPDKLFQSVPLYILISTDSVYEVVNRIDRQAAPVAESVTNVSASELLKKLDKYGYNKLMAERALLNRAGGSQSVFALRLPDVIGEFDDTLRVWSYKLWLESGLPIHVPESDTPLAFVYAGDVCLFITHLIATVVQTGLREMLNICCNEQVPLREFLLLVARAACMPASFTRSDKSLRKSYLPSVERRKAVLSTERARMYGWSPTPLAQAVNQTVTWLAGAEQRHLIELRECLDGLPKPVRSGLGNRFPSFAPSSGKHKHSSSSSSDSSSDSSTSSFSDSD